MRDGLVHETGLIAHGRGEAFDYLLGEKTNSSADDAARIAASALLFANNPVISVNGNVVALVSKECVSLAYSIPAKLEVNLFHRSEERIGKLVFELKKHGAKEVYGTNGDASIVGLDHDRGICDNDSIFSSDVVLVSLEDGDRCKALRDMGKIVVAIDLNPLSRTAKSANITIVDNVIRAIPNIERWVYRLKNENRDILKENVISWDNEKMLINTLSLISKRLNSLF
jgi:4-phosphopantoate--beta-alanine ligase